MKIITQLFILTLSLLQINADQHCDDLFQELKSSCILPEVTTESCCELKKFLSTYAKNGVYKIRKGTFTGSDNAYCDMITTGGGWVVIQRNKKSSLVNFNRNWTDYEKGFGDLNTEFWYGLQEINCLTQRGQWEMRVDYQFNNKSWSYLHYNQFSVGSASEKYLLTVGGFTGVGMNRFSYHNYKKFTTPDNDNDDYKNGNCATQHKNGWWFYNCDAININEKPPVVDGVALFTEMKIRPKSCITQ